MSRLDSHLKRRLGALFLAGSLAVLAAPAASQASEINLATASPFVVLGGETVTNTGPTILNGDLGVAPGTALPGFGSAVQNGATHADDEVAKKAQLDVITAYNAAAGQPVPKGNDLSTTDLGERTLIPGAYRYTSSAQLTGALTLDAQGDPEAQFVFEIGSALTTAPGSSVILTNGASPCNVYWQVGSSATLDTTTAFAGNVMALASITLNTGASVNGRVLAREGQVELHSNTLTRPFCATKSPNEVGPTPPTETTPVGSGGAGEATPISATTPVTGGGPTGRKPAAVRATESGTAVARSRPRDDCTEGFRSTVSGKKIKRVVFSLDGKKMANLTSSPFAMSVTAAPGRHTVRARVTFKDKTPAKTMTMAYRACAAAALRPHRGPSEFTG